MLSWNQIKLNFTGINTNFIGSYKKINYTGSRFGITELNCNLDEKKKEWEVQLTTGSTCAHSKQSITKAKNFNVPPMI